MIVTGTLFFGGSIGIQEYQISRLPEHLKLKVDKIEILEESIYQEYDYEEFTRFDEVKQRFVKDIKRIESSQRDEVMYAFKTNTEKPKVDDKEILEKRTNSNITRLENINEDGSKTYSIESGHPQIKVGSIWYKVDFATTTKEAFDLQTKSIIQEVFALDTGYKSPSSTGTPNNSWTNPTNAYSSNDAYATASEGASRVYQSYGTFGFGIPAGATINGIEVSAEAKTGSGTHDLAVGIYDGTAVRYKYQNHNTTEQTLTSGSSIDLWSGSWADTDFSDANFYLNFGTSDYDDGSTDFLDHIQVKVYYTEALISTSNPKQNIIWFD